MRILLVGGGSGGHVTPLKAIAQALQSEAKNQSLHISVVTDRSFYRQTEAIFKDLPDIQLRKITSGKLRRYQSKSLLWHFTHLPTLLRNIRDVFCMLAGTCQSFWLLLSDKPHVVFCKGGYVCVPVGFVAHILGIPLIIHDSDTRPGLTNRILSRWASTIATGMPTSFYPYPSQRMIYTGIPIDIGYRPLSVAEQKKYKKQLGFSETQPLVLVTGGGNGSAILNQQITHAAPQLLTEGWGIIQLAGSDKAEPVLEVRKTLSKQHQRNWQVETFAEMLPRLLAADIVVARTSASTLQECANAQKTVIGIPSIHLGDQKENAEYFSSVGALKALAEPDLDPEGHTLRENIIALYTDQAQATKYAKTLHTTFAKPRASSRLAEIILQKAVK